MKKNMKAEIISIGDELLIGQTVNTNASWIGAELSKIGFSITRCVAIPDSKEDILNALSAAKGKVEIALITGGLGPTSDDITKSVLCEFFGTRLVSNQVVLEMITTMMTRRNFQMNENNRRQADVPENCRVLLNETGTAPGMWFEKGGTIFVSMPGVPPEMKHIMTERVLPELKTRFVSQAIVHKNIMTYGMPEAKLAGVLAVFESELPPTVKLAYLPSYGIIKLRLTGKGESFEAVRDSVSVQAGKLCKIIGDLVYGEDEETMEMAVGRLLKEKKATMCTAESCTGGSIAHLVTTVPGSSAYYKGSVIAYSNEVKIEHLGVPAGLIEMNGAVSREVAEAMAKGSRKAFSASFSVAVTGIAGPDGGSEEKPAGTVWISVDSENGTVSRNFTFGTDRIVNILRFSIAALNMLRQEILRAK
ncbi:MAG TPA: competence/damage-inducible protein A [Bacteroidales bacterium]|nr:competence/damage-inducible protein A [Bacteroidales bacterium]